MPWMTVPNTLDKTNTTRIAAIIRGVFIAPSCEHVHARSRRYLASRVKKAPLHDARRRWVLGHERRVFVLVLELRSYRRRNGIVAPAAGKDGCVRNRIAHDEGRTHFDVICCELVAGGANLL